ncbi:MAG TPA: DUF2157 domain-containing protein [Parvularculaceae bacterium]|nr:DUF2157 domain-containing protein [Parvularculaceae bacterium]
MFGLMKKFGAGAERGGSAPDGRSGYGAPWRAIVHALLENGKLAPGDYLRALGLGPGPQRWALALFIFFGAAQIAAGLIFFFAYNWRDLSDMAKIALPQIAMAVGFLGWLFLPARSPASVFSGIVATLMIGVSMGVVGQVYQLGADPWTLFAVWAAFALPLSLLARSDAHFTVFALIATAAYYLYADEVMRPKLIEPDAVIPAIYAGGMIGVLALRDFVAEKWAGEAPGWQRWFFAASALFAALTAAMSEIFTSHLFDKGAIGFVALALSGGVLFFLYSAVRPDRPVRALSLFALAVYIGALGARVIFEAADFKSAFSAAALLIASAGWIIAVTAGLAFALKKTAGPKESA